MSKKQTDALLQFLNRSPTAWHAIREVVSQLEAHGFVELKEGELWSLKAKGKYFVVRNGSSLCAFIVPSKTPLGARVVASHTDSPGFKLKPNAEFRKENMVMLGLEVYGGPLITSWLNRDLGIAGRISYLDKKSTIQEAILTLDKNPVTIPQLAIHLDRKVNDEGLLLNKQEQLAALACLTDEKDPVGYLEKLLQAQVSYKKLLSHDLFVYPLEPAAYVGEGQQLMAAYRIDSLNSVHAIVAAFEGTSADHEEIKVIALLDNEEIGSETAQGAGSPFLTHTLERICLALKMGREEYLRFLSQSLCVSVDLAHALHPNYGDRHEPRHMVLMQKGIAVKYNAQKKYASDARSAAAIVALCHANKIPVQHFASKGDILSGSTIGPIHAAVTGMATVDIGYGQLSMHSCRELAACQDYLDMTKLLVAYLGK
ncbi:MAG: M18 family aminopeptidase [Parachlamydiaceae bacterium]|nr:M18 family aminopeptidase [Parachlamydiaceae bacterium]